MRSVLMNEDAVTLLAVAVSADMRALIYHQYTLTRLVRTMRHHGTIETSTDNK